jgi:hypothetical protein
LSSFVFFVIPLFVVGLVGFIVLSDTFNNISVIS